MHPLAEHNTKRNQTRRLLTWVLAAVALPLAVAEALARLRPRTHYLGFVWSAKSANPAGGRLLVNFLPNSQEERLLGETTLSPSVLPSVTIKGAPALVSNFVVLGQSTPQATQQQKIVSLLDLS